MNDTIVKLEVFESALWDAYKKVQAEEGVMWCSLHKVMVKVGMSLPLFSERLKQLWECQFTTEPMYANKYSFGLEVDCTPTERHRLRNKLIIIDHCPMFIIQMGLKKQEA